MATSSQRISFAQLVMDMGLADKQSLLKAKKRIKAAKTDGRKLTVARACVELEILSERQAKKVQHKLKRLKEGFASSAEFHGEEAVARKEIKKARKKSAQGRVSGTGKVSDKGRVSATGKVSDKGAVEGKKRRKSSVGEEIPGAKAKKRKSGTDEDAPKAKKRKSGADEDAPKAKKRKSGADEDAPKAKKRKSDADEDAPKAKKRKSDADEDAPKAKAKKKGKKPEPESVGGPVSEAAPSGVSDSQDSGAVASSEAASEEPVSEAVSSEVDSEAESEAASEVDSEAESEAASEEASEADSEADSEVASESEPASEDEEEAPKGKLGKKGPAKKGPVKKGPAKKGPVKKGPVKGKAKLGKEVMLDSQRAAKQTTGKRKRGAGRNRGMADAEDGPPRQRSKAPLFAIAGSVTVLLIMAIVVAMGSDKNDNKPNDGPQVAVTKAPIENVPRQPRSTDGPPRKGPAKGKDRASWTPKERELEAGRLAERLTIDAGDLKDVGKYAEAIAKLETFPEDLKKEDAYRDVKVMLDRLRQLAPEKKRLWAALTAGREGGKETLVKMIKEVVSENYTFAGEGFLELFRDEAREILGEERFDEIVEEVSIAEAGVDDFEEDKDQWHKTEFAGDLEVETRGTPERHQALLRQLPDFQKNLDAAKARLREKAQVSAQKLQAQNNRAQKRLKGGLKTDKGESCSFAGLTENGFKVTLNGKTVAFGWGNSPAKLGFKVKAAATDTNDKLAVYKLAMYALKRALFNDAERLFASAGKLGSTLKVPNIDELKPLVLLFRGKTDYTEGKTGSSSVTWDFKNEVQDKDFRAYHNAIKSSVKNDRLTVQAPQGFPLTAARVQGSFENEATLSGKALGTNPPPALWVSTEAGQFMVSFGNKTQLYADLTGRTASKKDSDVTAGQGDEISVHVKQSSKTKIVLTAKVGGRECFSETLDGHGEITFMVGARGSGKVEFSQLKVDGEVSAKWARRTLAAAPGRLSREVAKFEAQLKAGTQTAQAMPEIFKPTSAEDDVAMQGVPQEQIDALKEARNLFARGDMGGAMRKLEKASSNPLFHAANFAYAAYMVRRDPPGAMIRLKRAVKGVQDFYEAKTAKASAYFWLHRHEEARREVAEALALRPDYAPAYVVRANLLVSEGKYEEAIQELAIAAELAPGDPFTVRTTGQVMALAEGPAWFARKTVRTKNYVLQTDMVEYADKFVTQLESIRKRYDEAFPNLKVGDLEQPASVLIFSEPQGYYNYSERTGVGRVENTLGHFNPWSGQLLLFLEEDPEDWNSFHVIFHEGMHQWCDASGLELPFWCNEGMAEYVGGTRLSDDGKSIKERGAIDSFLKKRLINLTTNWSQRESFFSIAKQSPQEFYAGNASLKYAQAWTMIHFFMESGFPGARKAFFAYLDAYNALKTPEDKKSAQEGSKMQYIWNDTLGQLDRDKAQAAWEEYVQKLAKRAGLNWTKP